MTDRRRIIAALCVGAVLISGGAVASVAHGARGGREERIDPFLFRDATRLGDSGLERTDAFFRDRTVGCQVAHQAQHRPITRRRQRPTPRTDIGSEHMDGVRSDVEDSQAHGTTLLAPDTMER